MYKCKHTRRTRTPCAVESAQTTTHNRNVFQTTTAPAATFVRSLCSSSASVVCSICGPSTPFHTTVLSVLLVAKRHDDHVLRFASSKCAGRQQRRRRQTTTTTILRTTILTTTTGACSAFAATEATSVSEPPEGMCGVLRALLLYRTKHQPQGFRGVLEKDKMYTHERAS